MEVTLQPIHMHPSLITQVNRLFNNCGIENGTSLLREEHDKAV